MKKLFMALALVIATTACNKMEEFESASNFVLTGYNESNADSRTAFGTPNESTIPFLWSSGDYIWLGQTKSDAINADCQIANFTFSGGSPAYSGTGHVFYNLTGNSEYAEVLNNQTADGNLGNDGDPEKYQFSVNFLQEEIERCKLLGITKLVLHPGSHVGLGMDRAISNIANAINMISNEIDDYSLDKISYSLSYNGTMSLSGNKIMKSIY